jgi:DNA-binding transcriptional MerR regulator
MLLVRQPQFMMNKTADSENLLCLSKELLKRMNNIKNIFSIKDLENLSGIKAHTIRIWEKRYNVFSPSRSGTNIRSYDTIDLQKLLNITLLHNHGYKISKISKLPDENIPVLVREIMSHKSVKHHAVNAFKMAMMNFDQRLFLQTYDNLLSEKSFREVFYEVVIPLMDEIGILWQTGTITPAHEHFISGLIRQKVILNTEKLQVLEPTRTDRTFILFLPLNEVHELGLMYINFEILSAGYRSIYLGESMPIECLRDVEKYFGDVVYVSYFTVEPAPDDVLDYITKISNKILKGTSPLWLLGHNTKNTAADQLPDGVKIFRSIAEVAQQLQE